jgi:hypothetical protein
MYPISQLETGTKPEPTFADGRAALVLADAAGESPPPVAPSR